MEKLKDLKEFLNTLSEEQLETNISDNMLTSDTDENGIVEDLDFKIATEDYWEFDEGIYTDSEMPQAYLDGEGGDLEQNLDDWKKENAPKYLIGDVIITAKHYGS